MAKKVGAIPAGGVVSFFQRTGIVAGAILAMLALLNIVASFAWKNATQPIMEAISAEASARDEADKELTAALQQVSRDRLDLLDVLVTPAGSQRQAKIEATRRRWTK